MTSNQRLTATLSVLAALFVAFVLGHAIGHDSDSAADRVLFSCETVDASEAYGHTDDYLALVRSIGYKGDPTDGAERLYSPGCNR